MCKEALLPKVLRIQIKTARNKAKTSQVGNFESGLTKTLYMQEDEMQQKVLCVFRSRQKVHKHVPMRLVH